MPLCTALIMSDCQIINIIKSMIECCIVQTYMEIAFPALSKGITTHHEQSICGHMVTTQ